MLLCKYRYFIEWKEEEMSVLIPFFKPKNYGLLLYSRFLSDLVLLDSEAHTRHHPRRTGVDTT